MVGTYTCKRQTQRWPMVLWYNIIYIATLNAYTFFTAQHPEFKSGITNARRLFLKELSKELVTPHMRSRLEGCPQLQTPIIEAMERCGVTKATTQPQERSRQGQPKRKRCQICPSNKDRKVNNRCGKCNVRVCNDHSQKQVVCLNCIQWWDKKAKQGKERGTVNDWTVTDRHTDGQTVDVHIFLLLFWVILFFKNVKKWK